MTFPADEGFVADAGPRPREVLGRLPWYAAGKPPKPVDGMQSFKLSSNENPWPPLPSVLEAISARTDINRYPDPATTALRTALAGHLGVPAADIVTGAGSLGALNQILSAFAGQHDLAEPDEVVYAWRSFEAYPICVGLAGARGVQVPLRRDGTHNLDAMAAAVTERTSVVLLCTPNNPTGPALEAAATKRFLEQLPSRVVAVIDEAYEDFVRTPGAVDGIEFYRRHPNVVVLRTFSKAHGLAGLRVGYSVSHPELTRHIRLAAVPFAVTALAEDAAVASLQHAREVSRRVEGLVVERERVLAGLREHGWEIPVSDANFVWLNLGAGSDRFGELAAERGLSVRVFPGEGVRVTIGETEANDRFVELVAECPAELRARLDPVEGVSELGSGTLPR